MTHTGGFLPWGLLPVAALVGVGWFALLPFARGAIEGVTRDTVEDALARGGFSWATAEVSGQFVTLRGEPPDRAAARAAVEATRAATAATWAGPLAPVVAVWDEISAPPPAWLDWSFRLDQGVLTLAGAVPDASSRDEILRAARARAAVESDALLVRALPEGEEGRTAALLRTALRGAEAVTACDRGEATFAAGVLSLQCEVAAAEVERVRALASAPLEAGTVGAIDVLSNEAIAACEAELAGILDAATIEFPMSSAEVPRASAELLDRVAAVARECPGRLRVEGHTDSVGDPEYNVVLSQRRAEAVRNALVERGVPGDRLVAEGFGDHRPKAFGRANQARNRRIEMRVVRSAERDPTPE